MKLLKLILGIIFYILFFSWGFFKSKNIILINKLNCKEIYKDLNKDLRKQKMVKFLFIIIIAIIMAFIIYIVIGLVVLLFSSLMVFIYPAYVEAGANSTIFNALMSFVAIFISSFKYIGYVIYIFIYSILYLILARALYINILSYKQLNNGNIFNYSQQKTKILQNNINGENNTQNK